MSTGIARKKTLSDFNTEMTDSFDRYLEDIGKIPMFKSKKEEREVAELAAQGDEEARNRLVEANLRFVVDFVKKYENRGLSFPELVAAGNEGMINATENFDLDQEVKFITYAVWHVKNRVLNTLAEQTRAVKIRSSNTALIDGPEITAELTKHGANREAIISLLKEKFECSRETALMAMTKYGEKVGFDDPINSANPNSRTFAEGYENEDVKSLLELVEEKNLGETVAKSLGVLNDRERKLISMHYGLNRDYDEMSLAEIGRQWGVTREATRQTRDKALRKLRESSYSRTLHSLWSVRESNRIGKAKPVEKSNNYDSLQNVVEAIDRMQLSDKNKRIFALRTGFYEGFKIKPYTTEEVATAMELELTSVEMGETHICKKLGIEGLNYLQELPVESSNEKYSLRSITTANASRSLKLVASTLESNLEQAGISLGDVDVFYATVGMDVDGKLYEVMNTGEIATFLEMKKEDVMESQQYIRNTLGSKQLDSIIRVVDNYRLVAGVPKTNGLSLAA